MKFEYCCTLMKDAINDRIIDILPNEVVFNGWDITFCPFCGERIEITTNVRNGND